MSAAHWQGGKYVFPSQDGSGFESECFASIEDAAGHAGIEIVEWVNTAYDEWTLGIEGITTLRHAAQYMERAEQEFGTLADGEEDPQQWLREGREARVGNYFVAPCDDKPPPWGPCQVHPPEEE